MQEALIVRGHQKSGKHAWYVFFDICQSSIISQRKDFEFRGVNGIHASAGCRLIGDGPTYSDYK